MQTILKVICDNRGQSQMIEDYIHAFCSRFADDAAVPEFPAPDSDDVAFARDDCPAPQDGSADEANGTPGSLGSFCSSIHKGSDKMQFIFINPVIVSYRRNGQKLRLWVGSPTIGKPGNTESE